MAQEEVVMDNNEPHTRNEDTLQIFCMAKCVTRPIGCCAFITFTLLYMMIFLIILYYPSNTMCLSFEFSDFKVIDSQISQHYFQKQLSSLTSYKALTEDNDDTVPSRRRLQPNAHSNYTYPDQWTRDDYVYRKYARIYLEVFYRSKHDHNILTPALLDKVHQIEQGIKAWDMYHEHSLLLHCPRPECDTNSDLFIESPPGSLITYLYPQIYEGYYIYDGNGAALCCDIKSTIRQYIGNNHKDDIDITTDFFDFDFNLVNVTSKYLAAVYPFAFMDGNESYSDLKSFVQTFKTYFESHLSSDITADIGISYSDSTGSILHDELIASFHSDLHLAVLSLIFTSMVVYGYIRSLFITLFGIVGVLSSFVPCFAIVNQLYGDSFSFIGLISIWIILGIGCDDMFVFISSYRRSSRYLTDAQRMSFAYRESGTAMLVTSFTTAFSFYSLCFSHISPVPEFGVFVGSLVIVNYVLVMTWFPAIIQIYIFLKRWLQKYNDHWLVSDKCFLNKCHAISIAEANHEDVENLSSSIFSIYDDMDCDDSQRRMRQRKDKFSGWTNAYFKVMRRYKVGIVLILFVLILSIYFGYYCSVVSVGKANIDLLPEDTNYGQLQIAMDHVDINSRHYFAGGSQYTAGSGTKGNIIINRTQRPTKSPTMPTTAAPTRRPTPPTTAKPTRHPIQPTTTTTAQPTEPTTSTTVNPTHDPTVSPTFKPTTEQPTAATTVNPTQYPTTIHPTFQPTPPPITGPTTPPLLTDIPTVSPITTTSVSSTTQIPTLSPITGTPTQQGFTNIPTFVSTERPTVSPMNPTVRLTMHPTVNPIIHPTVNPTVHPTITPLAGPTMNPTLNPTLNPTVRVTTTVNPTAVSTIHPTAKPIVKPTAEPTMIPTLNPIFTPTESAMPTTSPTYPWPIKTVFECHNDLTILDEIRSGDAFWCRVQLFDQHNSVTFLKPSQIALTFTGDAVSEMEGCDSFNADSPYFDATVTEVSTNTKWCYMDKQYWNTSDGKISDYVYHYRAPQTTESLSFDVSLMLYVNYAWNGVDKAYTFTMVDAYSDINTEVVSIDHSITISLLFGTKSVHDYGTTCSDSNTKQGTMEFDTRFNIYSAFAQTRAIDLCDALEALGGADATMYRMDDEQRHCHMKKFAIYLNETRHIGYPITNKTEFNKHFFYYMEKRHATSDIGLDAETKEHITWISQTIETQIDSDLSASKLFEWYHKWEKFIDDFNKESIRLGGRADGHSFIGLQTSNSYIKMDVELAFLNGFIKSVGYTIMVCGVIMILFTQNLALSLLVCVYIMIIVIWVLGIFGAFKWEFGIIEIIAVPTVVGLTIDYALHITHAYIHSPHYNFNDRVNRSKSAINNLGSSVCVSALTTISSMFLLYFATISVFSDLGFIVSVTTTFGLFLAICVCPPLLSYIGPQNDTCQLSWFYKVLSQCNKSRQIGNDSDHNKKRNIELVEVDDDSEPDVDANGTSNTITL